MRRQLLGIQEDSNLTALPTVEFAAAACVDGLNGAAQLFVGDCGEFAATHGAAHEKRHDGIGMRILFGYDGGKGVARQPVYRSRDLFTDVLCRTLDVALEHKGAGDVRKTLEGIDADFVNAANGRDGVFERQDDSGDHLFRSGAGKAYCDVDGCGIGFGKKVNGQAAVAKHAKGDEKRNQHHRQDALLYASFGKLHRFIGSSLQKLAAGSSRRTISPPLWSL